MAHTLRTLSLCSGIGGLELGVGLITRIKTMGYVERDAFAASVLLARMEDETLERVPVWCGDIHDLDAGPLRGHVDLVTAGYPCQPFSCAGKRRGGDDPRHLWPQVARVLGEVRPRYVFLENVSAHLRLGFDTVLADLAQLGFDAEWTIVGADTVGAPHRRKRLFVLAHARCERKHRLQPGGRGGQGRQEEASPSCDAEDLAYTSGPRLEGRAGQPEDPGGQCAATERESLLPLWPPGPDPELWKDIPAEAQPALRGASYGASRGLERSQLGALGNAAVPLAAAYAFRTLWERIHPLGVRTVSQAP